MITYDGTRTKPQPGTPIDWSHPLARGLVGVWVFNEGGGTTVHNLAKPGIGNGTLQSGVTWQGGIMSGPALKFPNSDTTGYVDCGANSAFQISLFTVETYVRYNSADAGGNRGFVSKGDNAWALYYDNTHSGLAFYTAAGGGGFAFPTTYSSVTNGQWYHIVGTYDGTNTRFYVNGTLFASATGATGAITDLSASLYFGRNSTVTGQATQSTLSYVRYYNRVLAATEIAQLHQQPFAMFDQPQLRAALWTPGGGGTDVNVNVNALAMGMTPQATTVSGDANVALNSTALTMTPQAVTVRGDANVTLNALALAMNAQAVTVSITGDVNVNVNALAMAMTPQNVSVSTGSNVTLNALAMSMAAQAVAVSVDQTVNLNALAMSMAAQPVSVSTQSNVSVALNALALSMTPLPVSVNSVTVMSGGLSGLSGLSGLGATH